MTGPVLKVVRENRWLVWRDIALLGMTVVILLLALQVRSLQSQLATASATRTAQLNEVNAQLTELQQQLGVKDARIRQLTDQLLRAGLEPEPSPSVRASGSVMPSPVAGPEPSPTPGPSPRPSPTPQTSPSPSPSPSPSATCTVSVLGRCVVP